MREDAPADRAGGGDVDPQWLGDQGGVEGAHQYSSLGSMEVAARSTRILMRTKIALVTIAMPWISGKSRLQHRIDGEQPQTGIIEDVFDDDHAAEQAGELHPEQVEQRDGGVAQGMSGDDPARRQSADMADGDVGFAHLRGDGPRQGPDQHRRQFHREHQGRQHGVGEAAIADRRQPAELHRQQQRQDDTEPEIRQ